MNARHDAIGIKQAIRLEWMQKTANLLLAGLDAKTIRQELHDFLADKNSNRTEGKQSEQTRAFVVTNLMKTWVTPEMELVPFRDASLSILRDNPSLGLAVHWGMISAAYPFWFNVARQTGRLLALQDQVTHAQIINRLKEHYGDRQTVSRYGQFVIRSFVAWGVLKDAKFKGCYAKAAPFLVSEASLAVLLIESELLATPDGKGSVGLLLNNPALFPFQLLAMTSDFIAHQNGRIGVFHYGLDNALCHIISAGLVLKTTNQDTNNHL